MYRYFVFSLFENGVICNLRYYYFTMRCDTTLRHVTTIVLQRHHVTTTNGLFYYDITSLLRMGCFTMTSRHYYEWVVLLRHHVTTKNGLFYYDITSLLRRGCALRVLRYVTITIRSCTNTLRYYYEWFFC